MFKIYVITNSVTGKQYVGQTIITLSERLAQHASQWSYCTRLKRAISKYGKSNFTIKLLDRTDNSTLANIAEEKWIKALNTLSPNGYNLKSGGSKGRVHEDTKRKISLANKGKRKPPFSVEHCRKISEWHKGRPLSPEHRTNIGKGNTGNVLSDEHRKKISESERGKIISQEHINKALATRGRPFFNVYDKTTGELLGTWQNMKECARALGVRRRMTISDNVNDGVQSRKFRFEILN